MSAKSFKHSQELRMNVNLIPSDARPDELLESFRHEVDGSGPLRAGN
jgi:hypothetical protein